MKYFFKNFLIFIAIFLLTSTVFYFLSSAWLRTLLKTHFSPIIQTTLADISNSIKEKRAQGEPAAFANRFLVRNKLSTIWGKDPDGRIFFDIRRGPKYDVLELLSVRYPITSGGEIYLAPGYEDIVRVLTEKNNFYVFFTLFGLWAILISYLPYLYFRKSLLGFVMRFADFFEKIDLKDVIQFSFKASDSRWQTVASKLNMVKEKYTNTGVLLNTLLDMSKTLRNNTELSEAFNKIIEFITSKFEGVSCAIVMLGEDGFFKVRAQSGFYTDFLNTIKLKENEGYLGEAFTAGKTVIFNDIKLCDSKYVKKAMTDEGLESFAYIPIRGVGKSLGILNVSSKIKGYFTQEKMKVLNMFADFLSVTMQNYRLFSKVNMLNRRLETEIATTTRELLNTNSRLISKANNMKALSDIVILATSSTDIKEVFALVTESAKNMMPAQYAGFIIYYEDIDRLMPFSPFFGFTDEKIIRNLDLNDYEVLRSVVKEEKSFVTNDPSQAKAALGFISGSADISSAVISPLIRPGKKPMGIFVVANKIGGNFIQEDVSLVELISDRISGSVESMKLNRELEKTVRDLTACNEVALSVAGEPVTAKIADRIVSSIQKAFNADLSTILLYDDESKRLVQSFTEPGSEGQEGIDSIDETDIIASSFKNRETFLSPNVAEDERIKHKNHIIGNVNSLMVVPLEAERGFIGVLIIGKKELNSYTDENMKLAAALANQATVIIENAQLYEMLKKTNIELERLNNTNNEFISMISKDINVPVLAVEGFVKVVLSGQAGSINPQQEKFLRIAYQSIEKLAMLVENFIDLSKIESGQANLAIKPIAVNEVMGRIREAVLADMESKKIDLQLSMSESLPMVLADSDRLHQIFTSILSNNSRLVLEGGQINISARVEGDFVLFSISDNGIGIPKNDQEKIFEKFYPRDSILSRLIPVSLALSKSLLELHKGRIWVESDGIKGTSFKFTVPLSKEKVPDIQQVQQF